MKLKSKTPSIPTTISNAIHRFTNNYLNITFLLLQDEAMDIPFSHTIDFILPVQRKHNAKAQKSFPFVTLLQRYSSTKYTFPEG